MIVSTWLNSLRPFLTEVSTEWPEFVTSDPFRDPHELKCHGCSNDTWRLRVCREPVFAKTHWMVSAECEWCARLAEVFDANSLGWSYPATEPQNLACDCGKAYFKVTVVFEPAEDTAEEDDMSWVWVWAKCSDCGAQQAVVDWELD